MSKILRIALAIAFIIVFYTGELVGIMFDYQGINVVPTPTWILLLFATCAANVASAFWISRADPPRNLAFWGLFLKVCFLPIFLADFYIFVLMRSWFPPSPEVSPLGFFLITPYVVLSCPLMIVSSCYGFAAIDRARDEQLISPERARKYKWGLALPIADLVAAIWLYARLRRLDGTAPTCTPDDDPLSPTHITPQPVADIDDILAIRPAQTRRAIPHPWPTVLPLAASLCFIIASYAGGPVTLIFPPPYPTLRIDVWFLVMFVCALATIVSADAFKGAHNPKTLALWCLVFKLALLPFFLTMTLIVLVLGSYFFAQRGLIFVTFIMLPLLLLGTYCIMRVTSSHGSAAISRARNQRLVCRETANKLQRGLATPIADLISSIRLYALLRRLDDASETTTSETL